MMTKARSCSVPFVLRQGRSLKRIPGQRRSMLRRSIVSSIGETPKLYFMLTMLASILAGTPCACCASCNCLTIIGRPRGNSSSHVPNAENFRPARPVTSATTASASAELSMNARSATESRGARSFSLRGKKSRVIKKTLCRSSVHASSGRPNPPSLRRRSFHVCPRIR
jgi:hypothetical protein